MKNYIRQIIELFGHNEYSAETQKKVQGWLADEKHSDEKTEALQSLWEEAAMQDSPRGMQQSIRRMRTNTGMSLTVSSGRYKLLVWKIAAALLFATSAASIYFALTNDMKPKELIQSYVPTTSINKVTLPDGTQVIMNSRSTLLYPEEFDGKTRSVYLLGEASFKVKPDKEHPFIVKANDFQVTALGTEFNVKAYPDNDEVVATLIEGSVNVEFNNMTSHIILKPNEQITYNRLTKASNLLRPEMDDVTAWQRGDMVFDNMKLEDIFMTIERKYPYRFIFNFHSLKDRTYSFKFHKNASLEEVMGIIKEVAGDINYKIRGNRCYIE
jgi:ferric-dicitrate binding protein FerR (iron transport regulator)